MELILNCLRIPLLIGTIKIILKITKYIWINKQITINLPVRLINQIIKTMTQIIRGIQILIYM